jgi:hypothetical protein
MKNNKEFEGGGIHPFNSPLPHPSNRKRNLKIFKTVFFQKTKRKEIHQLTAYIWLRLLNKSLHPNLLSAPLQVNFRYTQTLCAMPADRYEPTFKH